MTAQECQNLICESVGKLQLALAATPLGDERRVDLDNAIYHAIRARDWHQGEEEKYPQRGD